MAKKQQQPRKTDVKAAGKTPRRRDLGPPPEAFEDLDGWADKVATLEAEVVQGTIAMYDRLAAGATLSAESRRFAKAQADAVRRAVRRAKAKAKRKK